MRWWYVTVVMVSMVEVGCNGLIGFSRLPDASVARFLRGI